MKIRLWAIVLTLTCISPALGQRLANPTITVSGEAVIKAEPDRILVTFGIETSDQDMMLAKSQNSVILEKAVASIQALGVARKEIQTEDLSISPVYKHEHTRENFIGYFVRNSFLVTLSDVSMVEDLVTEALRAGVTHILAIDFQTSEFKKYREQARELALRAAKEKAEKMTSALGQSVGPAIQVSETGSPYRYYSSWSGWGSRRNDRNSMSQIMVQAFQDGSSEIYDTVALGKISIQAQVRVIFVLGE